MKKVLLAIVLLSVGVGAAAQNKGEVRILSSYPTSSKMFVERKAQLQKIGKASGDSGSIAISFNQKNQLMDGVGAALTGSSAIVFKHNLKADKRRLLFEELFTPKGIGMEYVRLTIGASDFSRRSFSYCDEVDSTLAKFSLAEDELEVIPIMKEILAVNPKVKIMASPWSPPGWMKTSNSMVGGSLKRDCYDVYARYLIKYVVEMRKRGISIDAITVQNEPEYGTAKYPCMLMSAEEQKVFVRDYLGPKLKAQKEKLKIILFDHNCDNPSYPISILNDKQARQYIAGSGFHHYAGNVDALCTVHNAHPDKDLYFTEQSGGGWAPNFSDNVQWYTGHLMVGAMRCWSKNLLLWNLALDENDGPKNNGCPNCWGIVRVKTDGTVERNAEYYSLGHYGRFVRQGAARVTSDAGRVDNVAFVNPNGEKVVIAANRSDKPQQVTFTFGGKMVRHTFEPHEVSTFVWK
jgi:glucosylceramidase